MCDDMVMEMTEVLDSIPAKVDAAGVLRFLRARRFDPRTEQVLGEVIERVTAVARPRAMYRMSFVEAKGDGFVEIDGVRFVSKVMRKNLDSVERVFLYVATCGLEVESISYPGDVMLGYYLDAVKMALVGAANQHLTGYLKKRFGLGQVAHMNPGSLADWPLTEQRKLFSLLGDVEKAIGVRLSESAIMYPLKSTSGIIFPTEARFESCQLCPRERCMGRRMPYNPDLVKQYLGE